MAVAGSITATVTDAGAGLTKYSVAWLSNASGAVTENTFNVKAGELVQVEYVPDAGGTQPTDAYDMTLLNANGTDVLGGGGANLSNATRTQAVPAVSTYFRRTLEAGALAPTVSNAGNAKGGTIVLLVR